MITSGTSEDLWSEVVSFPNLLLAFRRASKGKRKRADVARFGLNLERELFDLRAELATGEYTPGSYRQFTIYERKPRIISAAPFRDRVVHHAVMNVVEPLLDPTFIPHSYACRKGLGVHRAVNYYQRMARRYAYALHMDVAQYFPSIDRQMLIQKLAVRIENARVLALLRNIIENAPSTLQSLPVFAGDDLLTPLERPCGIPIGNLTSQFLANLYLDDLDHWITKAQKVPAYLRYVDDMVVLDDSKARLADIREMVRQRLAQDRLLLHPRKAHIVPTHDGVSLLGYQVFPKFRRLRPDGVRFTRRRMRALQRAYALGKIDWPTLNSSIQSWIGHAAHADSAGLRKNLFSVLVFQRAQTE